MALACLKSRVSTAYQQRVFAFLGLVFAILWLSPDSLLVRLYTAGPFTQLFYKNLFFSAAIIPVFVVVSGGPGKAARATMETGRFLIVQSCLFTVTQFAFTLSITNTAAATTLTLLASSPLFASFFSRWILGERLVTATLLAMVGGLFGVGIVFVGNLIAVAESGTAAIDSFNSSNDNSNSNASAFSRLRLLSGDREGSVGNDGLGIVLGLMCAISLGLYLTIARYVAATRSGSELAPLMFVGPICCFICLFMEAYVITEPMDLLWAFVQGAIVGSLAFGTIAVCPRYLLSSEVGLVQLLETVLGPFWVWLAGFESPPLLTVVGGIVLLLTLVCYFSYTMNQDKKAMEAAETKNKKVGEIDTTEVELRDNSVNKGELEVEGGASISI